MTTMTVSEARAALPEVLDRVIAGDEVTITRHGSPVAVIVRPDSLRVRRAEHVLHAAEHVRALLGAGRSTPLAGRPTLPADRADELVAELRSGRAGRR